MMGDEMRERDYYLWERFKNGDRNALSLIYKSNYSFLYDYGYRIIRNHDIVRECIQELFFNIITHIDSLSTPRSIRAYLIASLRRKLFNRVEYDHNYQFMDESSGYSFDLVNSHEDFIIDEEIDSLKKSELQININKLPAREKEIIYLKYFKNMEYEEITKIMGIHYDSARKLVSRSIKNLRDMFYVKVNVCN